MPAKVSEERKKKTGVDYPECALAVGTVERSADRRQSHRHGTQKQGVPRLGIVTKMRKWFGKSTSKKGGDVTPKSQQTPPAPTAQAGSKAQTPARKGPASTKGQPVKSSSQTTVDTTRSDQRSRPSSPDESFDEDDDQPSRRSLTPSYARADERAYESTASWQGFSGFETSAVWDGRVSYIGSLTEQQREP